MTHHTKRTPISTQYPHGMHVEYSNVNMGWFVMWFDQVLRVFVHRWEAEATVEDWFRK